MDIDGIIKKLSKWIQKIVNYESKLTATNILTSKGLDETLIQASEYLFSDV